MMTPSTYETTSKATRNSRSSHGPALLGDSER
jgi:hypothetical protein